MANEQLIARLEAATGPEWELHAAIFAAVFPDKVPAPIVESGYGWRVGRGYWWLATGEDSRTPPKTVTPPNYTASIDAALTLVPEGWSCRVSFNPTSAYATVVHPDCDDTDCPDTVFSGGSKTPALAIVIAALKAKEASR